MKFSRFYYFSLQPLKQGERWIPKSRYDCIDMYISPCSKAFNDRPILYDNQHKQMLLDEGQYGTKQLFFFLMC